MLQRQRESKTWVPEKSWTAWPLPMGDVPHEGEGEGFDRAGCREELRDWRRGEREHEMGSKWLEGVVTAGLQKRARMRWDGKECEGGECAQGKNKVGEKLEEDESHTPSDQGEEWETPVIMADDEEAAKILRPTVRHILAKIDGLLWGLHVGRRGEMRSGSESRTSRSQASETVRREKEAGKEVGAESRTEMEVDEMVVEQDTQGKTDQKRPIGNGGTSSFRDKVEEPDYLEDPTMKETQSKSQRKRGRPRTVPRLFAEETNYAVRMRLSGKSTSLVPAVEEVAAASNRPTTTTTKRNARGRLKTISRLHEGESYDAIKKRPAGRTSCARSMISAASESPPSTFKRRRRSSGVDMSEKEEKMGTRKPALFHARDWSDILGMAALVGGFDTEVIERAAGRCAELFGEGMKFRTLRADGGLEEVEYRPEGAFKVEYVDQDTTMEGKNDDEGEEEKVDDNEGVEQGVEQEAEDAEHASNDEDDQLKKPPYNQSGPIFVCPFPTCPRSKTGWTDRGNRDAHLRNVHDCTGLSVRRRPRESSKTSSIPPPPDSTRAVLDGVHLDGFLQPISLKRRAQRLALSKSKDTNEIVTEVIEYDVAKYDGVEDDKVEDEEDESKDRDAGGQRWITRRSCPHRWCRRSTQPFREVHHVARHVGQMHGGVWPEVEDRPRSH